MVGLGYQVLGDSLNRCGRHNMQSTRINHGERLAFGRQATLVASIAFSIIIAMLATSPAAHAADKPLAVITVDAEFIHQSSQGRAGADRDSAE